MQATLIPHPLTPCAAVDRIEVKVERVSEGGLVLSYSLFGALDEIRVPEVKPGPASGPTDELWKHSCFEAFIRNADDDGYLELNFTMSGEWAAYRFSGYRLGMTPANVSPHAYQGWMGPQPKPLRLEVWIDPGRMKRPDLPASPWRMGLSAVVETMDGAISYWALAHPPGKPDFHHPDSFALILPPPEPA